MQLNLPILETLADCERILIAGAGGGFDIYAGLPLFFALRAQGKQAHLANFSFSSIELAKIVSQYHVSVSEQVIGVYGAVKVDTLPYYPEGYLADWFATQQQENIVIWMFERPGVQPLIRYYQWLVYHLQIDAIILVDGGVDSLMRGDELAPGTLVEDSITLAAIRKLEQPRTKILACLGFGTEVEERLSHYLALENMAALIKAGAFYGSCSLTPQMDAFRHYEAACRHAWEGGNGRHKSHISTRVIPATHGEFENYHMYSGAKTRVFISPLMSIYWFFDAQKVSEQSLVVDLIGDTHTIEDAFQQYAEWATAYNKTRMTKSIPYF